MVHVVPEKARQVSLWRLYFCCSRRIFQHAKIDCHPLLPLSACRENRKASGWDVLSFDWITPMRINGWTHKMMVLEDDFPF